MGWFALHVLLCLGIVCNWFVYYARFVQAPVPLLVGAAGFFTAFVFAVDNVDPPLTKVAHSGGVFLALTVLNAVLLLLMVRRERRRVAPPAPRRLPAS